jgi:hypothetical protein
MQKANADTDQGEDESHELPTLAELRERKEKLDEEVRRHLEALEQGGSR